MRLFRTGHDSSLFGVGKEGGSAVPSRRTLVASRAGGASVCQRRQPPKAVAEGQRLQTLALPATIGHRVGWAARQGYANDCVYRLTRYKGLLQGTKRYPPETAKNHFFETKIFGG